LKTLQTLFLLILISTFSFSQESGTNYFLQLSPEFRFNTNKFEFRYRPYESLFLTNTATKETIKFGRTDFMAGYVHNKFKLFVYAKFDTNNNNFIGPRLDFDTTAFDNRLFIHGEYRYFWALNKISLDHQYFINILEYDTKKFLNPGFFGLNQQTFKGSTALFYGPSVSFTVFKGLRLLTSFMKDLNARSGYFLFIRFGVRVRKKAL
jgi:hypothetical protein